MAPNVTVIDVHYDKGPEEGTTDIINCKEVILWDKTMEPVCDAAGRTSVSNIAKHQGVVFTKAKAQTQSHTEKHYCLHSFNDTFSTCIPLGSGKCSLEYLHA